MKVGDDILDLEQWDVVRVSPNVVRQIESGPDGLELIAIGGAPTGDSEMIEGWWTD
jgi:hypothetical protein